MDPAHLCCMPSTSRFRWTGIENIPLCAYMLGHVQKKLQHTSSPFLSVLRPDQKRWAQILTARHWSGFFSSLEAASAHWVLSGSWFSSLKHLIRSKVPMISVMAANWALESLISSSYREKAWWSIYINEQEKKWGERGEEYEWKRMSRVLEVRLFTIFEN